MSASVTTVVAALCALGIMANQLYAVPIIIEAFQTGKGAMRTDDRIRSLNKALRGPNNGFFIDSRRSLLIRLQRRIIVITAGISPKNGTLYLQYLEFPTFTCRS